MAGFFLNIRRVMRVVVIWDILSVKALKLQVDVNPYF